MIIGVILFNDLALNGLNKCLIPLTMLKYYLK